MTDEEIRKVVRETITELRNQEMLRETDEAIMEEMSERLRLFFSGTPDHELGKVLQEIRNDYYFEIIPLYFQQGMTQAAIASHLGADPATIHRNRKRLLRGIYTMLKC